MRLGKQNENKHFYNKEKNNFSMNLISVVSEATE